jgi:ATP-dependent DNA ligase
MAGALGGSATCTSAHVSRGRVSLLCWAKHLSMTDEMLAWQTTELRKLAIASDRYTVYVRPMLVVEIAFNEIQESTRYPGGLALRFARVKRVPIPRRAPPDRV